MSTVPSLPARYEISRLPGFLASADGHRWLGSLAENFPHSSYEPSQSDRWDLKRINAIGAKIVDAHYAGGDVDEAVAGSVSPSDCWDTWDHWVAPQVFSYLQNETGQEPDDGIVDTIRYGWEEGAIERDRSSPRDLFGSHDRVELLFRFNTLPWLDDALIHSRRPWADFSDLCVTDNLCFALAQLGFSLGDYRKASGNRNPAQYPLPRRHRRQRPPVVTKEQLRELVENACSTSFLLCLYAMVPIDQLFAIDLTRPVTFEACHVATMDPINGTFHDVSATGPLIVKPEDGRFLTGGHLSWSPDEICGLVPSYYAGAIRN
jgi:hypothetical protein